MIILNVLSPASGGGRSVGGRGGGDGHLGPTDGLPSGNLKLRQGYGPGRPHTAPLPAGPLPDRGETVTLQVRINIHIYIYMQLCNTYSI